jgi:uncharacterized integral membrane protein (TIGR00698 family)
LRLPRAPTSFTPASRAICAKSASSDLEEHVADASFRQELAVDAKTTTAPRTEHFAGLRRYVPGLALAGAIALAAFLIAPQVARWVPIPAMIIALIIGIALNPVARRPIFQSGIALAVKKILRWAVALLGLRIALGDIFGIGLPVALLVIVSMAATVFAGFLAAKFFRQAAEYGALAGVGTAVCGASATLATATALPDYRGKEADVVFVVVAVNALSTIAMLAYPPLCAWLGFNENLIGIMLGATIHDVAQVVGAGYAVSDTAGNSAVIVKLYRVFLLLPFVMAVGWYFARRGAAAGAARVPVPVFAIMFLVLCVINSIIPTIPALVPIYAPIKSLLGELSTWGLLLAIAALGLGTSFGAVRALGWRHVATVTFTTIVILVVATGGLMFLR